MEAYIAIDGGGSKTEFIKFNANGEVLCRLIKSGCNPNASGMSAALNVIKSGIEELFCSDVKSVFAGVAGCLTGKNKSVINGFLNDNFKGVIVYADSDIINVIYSSGIRGDCVAAICGTGAVAYRYLGGMLTRAGGWGYRFDGAGGGYDIGREVLRLCLAKDDGFRRPSIVTAFAEEELSGTATERLADIYARGNEYIASFAKTAFKAFDAGDGDAARIIEKSAARVSEIIVHAAGDKVKNAVIDGGLIRQPPFYEAVRKRLSGFALAVPVLPPVYGACRRAAELAGKTENEDFEKNFTSTYKEMLNAENRNA